MKHELRVLAGAGVVNKDNAGDDMNIVGDTVGFDGDTEMENSESGDDYYKQPFYVSGLIFEFSEYAGLQQSHPCPKQKITNHYVNLIVTSTILKQSNAEES
ncbi:hypothetical protein ACFE04_005792 [Oxalis oulophora]